MTVTLKCGLEVWTGQTESDSTIEDIKALARAKVGCGDNVNALINGVAMPDDALVADGSTIVIETRCNTKA